MIRLIDQV